MNALFTSSASPFSTSAAPIISTCFSAGMSRMCCPFIQLSFAVSNTAGDLLILSVLNNLTSSSVS